MLTMIALIIIYLTLTRVFFFNNNDINQIYKNYCNIIYQRMVLYISLKKIITMLRYKTCK